MNQQKINNNNNNLFTLVVNFRKESTSSQLSKLILLEVLNFFQVFK